MKTEMVDIKTFMKTIEEIEFKEDDIREAQEFGYKSIVDAYKRVANRYTRFFIVEEDGKPLVPIALDRCGYLTFFVSKELDPKKALKFVRKLKKLADWYTANFEKTLFVKVINWYKEANKLVKLVGFEPYILEVDYTTWVYERK